MMHVNEVAIKDCNRYVYVGLPFTNNVSFVDKTNEIYSL